jgi:DNA primase
VGRAAKNLEKKGVTRDVKTGLIKKTGGGWYDRFRDRVIFPIRDIKGRVVGFGGRTMGDDMPKYLNSSETPLFHKGETLYAMDAAAEAIRKKGYSVIVEGYFDAIACHKAGVDNAVATMGTAMTQQHLRALKRQSKNVLLVFDSDPAGIKAAERTLDIFLGTDMIPKVALLPKGDDPDSLVRREGAAGLAKRLKASGKLLDFVIKRAAEGAETIEKGGRVASDYRHPREDRERRGTQPLPEDGCRRAFRR